MAGSIQASTRPRSPDSNARKRYRGKGVHLAVENVNTHIAELLLGWDGTQQRDIDLSMIELDGTAWGSTVPLTGQWQEIRTPLSKLCPMKVAMLPQGWPWLNHYWLRNPTGGTQAEHLRIQNIAAVQISLGARFFPEDANLPHAIELESIILDTAN